LNSLIGGREHEEKDNITTHALVLVFSLVACKSEGESGEETGSDIEYVTENGKMVIGITEYEPMNYYDENGELIGFDTEFAQAVCAELGVEPVFQVINWDMKETELKAKNIDCIWNGLTVTEDRKENMDFTTSYLVNKQCIVINRADSGKFTSLESFADASLAAEKVLPVKQQSKIQKVYKMHT
jgi:polar amino acid transport system substrate-binding protein